MLKRVRDGDGDTESGRAPKRQKPETVRDERLDLQPPRPNQSSLNQPTSKHGGHRTRRPSNAPRSSTMLDLTSDRLTSLPHELIIRILHLLPFRCVLLCQLVSRRMRHLAGDAQVWKGLYYERFVRPRVMRLRGLGRSRVSDRPEKSSSEKHGLNLNGEKEVHTAGDGTSKSRGPGEGYDERKSTRKNKLVELPEFSSRESKWLDEWWLVDGEAGGFKQDDHDPSRAVQGVDVGKGRTKTRKRHATDWKARYKLRYNWSIGAAEIQEISLCPSMDKDMDEERANMSRGKGFTARLADGVVITVDRQYGLRAWDLKTRQCVAEGKLVEESNDKCQEPTCLAVDRTSRGEKDTGVVVGFRNGHFELWRLMMRDGERYFERQGKSPNRQIDEEINAVAYSDPHLLIITAKQVLSIYVFDFKETSTARLPNGLRHSDVTEYNDDASKVDNKSTQPRLLTSLRSHTCWPPLSLSIRSTPHSIIASIAYSLPTYLSGWSVGLQELHISPSGNILKSRLASGIEQGFQSLLSSSSTPLPLMNSTAHDGRLSQLDTAARRGVQPSSLSYSHPYLLAGNRDNTLTFYLVTSNNEELKISKGTTLWGHTSSVSGAQVGGRGKAVSVSARGDELRVWELEAGLGKKMVERSVRVKRDNRQERVGGRERTSGRVEMENEDIGMDTGWVGFDEEVVIVLRDGLGEDVRDDSQQKLVVYDFT